MKRVFIIIFKDENELLNGSDKIIKCFTELDDSKVYCGSWGEIKNNKEECLNAIASSVNYFIKSPEKKEIYFGCNYNDSSDIQQLLFAECCEIIKITYNDFIRSYVF